MKTAPDKVVTWVLKQKKYGPTQFWCRFSHHNVLMHRKRRGADFDVKKHFRSLAAALIGVSGSFFRGGQQLHPAKIQSLPARGGHVFCRAALPSFYTKLSCQWAEMKDK